MSDLKRGENKTPESRLTGKTIESIERDSVGKNSTMIMAFKEGGKVTIASTPNGGTGSAQLDVTASGIKLDEIIDSRIESVEKEYNGINDHIKFKLANGGTISVSGFGSSEETRATLSMDVKLAPAKITESRLVDENLNELSRLNRNHIADKTKYWAIYAGFYENIFKPIDDLNTLQQSYRNLIKSKEIKPHAKDALTFFYRVRRDEINDPNFWDKMSETKTENTELDMKESLYKINKLNMKKKLVAESLNEAMIDSAPGDDDYYDRRNEIIDRNSIRGDKEDPKLRAIAQAAAQDSMEWDEARTRADISAKRRKVVGGLGKLKGEKDNRKPGMRNPNTYDGTHDEDAPAIMDKVEGKMFDPNKYAGDKAAVGVDGQYRADTEEGIEVTQDQVDAAWAFVDKKQELIIRAQKSGASPEILAKREKYLNDAIEKAEYLESNL